MIKFFVAGILQRVLDRAIQVHGAIGLTDATLLSYWYRHERAARIYDGPDEVHKMVVARSVLKTASGIDAKGASEVREDVSMIKFFVAGILQKVIDRAIQVHGALGLTDETLLSYWYRHERAARIYDGPDEVHKIVVARSVLKRYLRQD